MRYAPSAVVVDRESPVSTLVALTAAEITTAPCGSFTVPAIVPVICCAYALRPAQRIRTSRARNCGFAPVQRYLANLRVFIQSSEIVCGFDIMVKLPNLELERCGAQVPPAGPRLSIFLPFEPVRFRLAPDISLASSFLVFVKWSAASCRTEPLYRIVRHNPISCDASKKSGFRRNSLLSIS